MAGGLSAGQRHAAVVLTFVVLLLAVLGGRKVFRWGKQAYTAESIMADSAPPEAMTQHASQYNVPEVKEVTEGITMAIGYAMANSIWLKGPDGIVVVDTTESMEAGRAIYAAMRQGISGPIKAIIYTHSHADHVYGAKAFVENPDFMPEVWAHYNFEFEIDNVATTSEAFMTRGMRQFGALLPRIVNAGIGVGLNYNYEKTIGAVLPNRIMESRDQNITVAGLTLELISIPGETDDQIGVWWAEKRAFLCADDVYKAFPNLYAIRGVPNRNSRKWIASLDRMRQLRPKYLVPSHGQPIIGEKLIYHTLTAYRDGLQYVHDQTVRFINQGWHPEDIAHHVRLPEELAKEPYLIPMYGTVEWSVRSVFDQYMGWFSGRAAEMAAITTQERAERMAKLAGGPDKLVEAARQAVQEGDYRWGLVLASHAFDLNKDDVEALEIRTESLKGMARAMTSTNGRHYYLTTAMEDHKFVQNSMTPASRKNIIDHMTIPQLFMKLRTSLEPANAKGVNIKILFHFSDDKDFWFAHLRHGILEVSHMKTDDWDLEITMGTDVLRQIFAGVITVADAAKQGLLKFQGDIKMLVTFGRCFERF